MKAKIIHLIKVLIIPLILFIFFYFTYTKKSLNLNSIYYYDEYSWVGRGYYFELLLKGDFKNKLWNVYGVDGDPKMTSYIYGLVNYPLYLKDIKPEKDMFKYLIDNNFFTGWLQKKDSLKPYTQYLKNKKDFISWQRSEANGKKLGEIYKKYGQEFFKTIRLILRARKMAIIFFCLSIIVSYYFGLLLFKNAYFSILLSSLFATSLLTSSYGTIAYSEPILLFFINLGLLAGFWIFNQKKPVNIFILIALGFIIACANQTKLNGVLLLFLYLATAILLRQRRLIPRFLTVFFSFVFFYVLFDPFLLQNPVKNVLFQYKWNFQITNLFMINRPTEVLRTFGERLIFLWNNLFEYRQTYLMPYFLLGTNFSLIISFLFKIFFAIGIIKKLTSVKRTTILINIYPFLLLLVFGGSLLFSLVLRWDRYAILLILPVLIFIIEGLMFLINVIFFYIKRLFKKPSLIFILIIVFGLAVRLYSIINREIFIDEVFYTEVTKANSVLSLITSDHWIIDHGPLTFIWLKFLAFFTSNIQLMRLPNLIIYLLTNLIVFRFFSKQKHALLGVFFAFFYAINPYFIYIQSLVSPFNFAFLFAVLVFIKTLEIICKKTTSDSDIYLLTLYSALAWFFDYSSYYLFILLSAVFIWVLFKRKNLVFNYLVYIIGFFIIIIPTLIFISSKLGEIQYIYEPETFTLKIFDYLMVINNILSFKSSETYLQNSSLLLNFLIGAVLIFIIFKIKDRLIVFLSYLLLTTSVAYIFFVFFFSKFVFSLYIERAFWPLYFLSLLSVSLVVYFYRNNRFVPLIFLLFFSISLSKSLLIAQARYPGSVPDHQYKFESLFKNITSKYGFSQKNILYVDKTNNLYKLGDYFLSKISKNAYHIEDIDQINSVPINNVDLIIVIDEEEVDTKSLKKTVYKSKCNRLKCFFEEDI